FGQGEDAGLLLLVERGVGVAGTGVVVAGLGEFAQPGVPVGFQGAGDQPVGGVDGQVAAPCGVGGVLGALHVGGADGVGLAGVGGQFGCDGHGGLQRERGEGIADQRGDRGVDAGAGDGLAGGPGVLDPGALAVVGRDAAAVGEGVVADGHAAAAAAADDHALQQRASFAGGPGGAVLAAGGGVGGEHGLVPLVLGPGQVAGMVIADEHDPVGHRPEVTANAPVQVGAGLAAAAGVSAGVAGVVQDVQHDVVGERLEVQLAGVRPAPVAARGGQGRGRVGCAGWRAATTAGAEPVAVKVPGSSCSAPRTSVSGSSMMVPAAS